MDKRIAFLGGGNMARAIIGGLVSAGTLSTHNVAVSDPFQPSLDSLSTSYPGIATTSDNTAAITFSCASNSSRPADVVVLAVKPQVMKQVAEAISATVMATRPLIITIAAGIKVSDLSRWLMASSSPAQGQQPAVVRVMPNTPALVSEGASALWCDPAVVTGEQKALAFEIMASFSKQAYWVEKESLLDVVTGVSGSGPAYFFYLLEALEQSAVNLGLPREIARGLAAQTCLGAGKMALASLSTDPAVLRKNVTSPNGTTEAAVKYLESQGVRGHFEECVAVATKRAEELADVLGKQ